MKKTVVFLLVTMMVFCCVACGGNDNNTQTPTESGNNTNTENNQEPNSSEIESESGAQLQITDATEILTKAWEKYKENEKFAVVGGHYSNYTDGAPAKYDITKVEDMEAVFCIPKESVALIDDAASLQHGMNVNNFSAMAYHITDSSKMQILIDDIKGMTMNNQWICGHPDRLIMITVGDEYLVTAFGNGEIVDNFLTKVLSLYNNVPELVVDEDL